MSGARISPERLGYVGMHVLLLCRRMGKFKACRWTCSKAMWRFKQTSASEGRFCLRLSQPCIEDCQQQSGRSTNHFYHCIQEICEI